MRKVQNNPYNQIRKAIEEACQEYGVERYKLTGEIIRIISEYNEGIESLGDDDVLLTYPGNPSVGDVVNVIVHEGRGPIGRHMHDSDNVGYWINRFNEDKDPESLKRIDKINKGILDNMEFFKDLFNQVEPLGSRPKYYQLVQLRNQIETDLVLFTEIFQHNSVECELHGGKGFGIEMSKTDITYIIKSLVLNSVEAMRDADSPERKISINISERENRLQYITIADTGPGFADNMLRNGRCFKAWYSTKRNRLGLGLMVAGEAANRNLLDLQILKTDKGATVRLVPKEMFS